MSAAAELILTNTEIHTLDSADQLAEAIAFRDGHVVKVGTSDSVELLDGVETETIDCGGRVVLPGFIDAHTHLNSTGRYLVHADLSDASDRETVLQQLQDASARHGEWHVGVGYDESTWTEARLLTRDDLDSVSTEHPVAAFRVDMHTASLNSVALELVGDDLPEEYIEEEDGTPTGVIVEDALAEVRSAIDGEGDLTKRRLRAAQDHALSTGVTCVHDFVRGSSIPRTYRELNLAGELDLRIRLNYWRDHLDAVTELGLRTNHGDDHLTIGGIKSFSDGSVGGRTAKVYEPYIDEGGTGTWVVEPETIREVVDSVDGHELQVAIHAIGDEALEEVLAAIESVDDPGVARHRIEHVEMASDDHIERLADTGIIASMQPNFLQWAEADGLYETALGDRYRDMNRFRDMVDAGVNLAFGSDSMPLDPLYGIHCAVNAPQEAQRLSVDEAISAYTNGSAYAGFDEHMMGHLAVGTYGDCVVLDRSPWEQPDAIENIEVRRTIIDGKVVYDGTDGDE